MAPVTQAVLAQMVDVIVETTLWRGPSARERSCMSDPKCAQVLLEAA